MNTKLKPIYLDYNATTPIAPEVAQIMIDHIESNFGNPSSAHWFGFKAQDAVNTARQKTANLLGCQPEEIIFTSCATEANNLAIQGTLLRYTPEKTHVITSAIEHPAVLEVCNFCRNKGFGVTIVPVDSAGLIDPNDIERAITKNTKLVTIMHANNEAGSIQPIQEISKIVKNHGVVFHTDAAQSVGKMPVNVDDLGVDLLTVAAHKFYGPKGVGALYIRDGIKIDKVFHGAGHERHLRPGTENVVGIVGLGAACELAESTLSDRYQHMKQMRDRLYHNISNGWELVRLNGCFGTCLPNTLSLGFRDMKATDLLNELYDLAVSAGAACHTPGQFDVSHVLKAMKVPLEYAHGTLRFSTGIMTTISDIDRASEMVIDVLRNLNR